MLDVSQNLLDKFHRFRCGHPPINAHHYGWPIVDLARGDVPAMFEMPRQQRVPAAVGRHRLRRDASR